MLLPPPLSGTRRRKLIGGAGVGFVSGRHPFLAPLFYLSRMLITLERHERHERRERREHEHEI